MTPTHYIEQFREKDKTKLVNGPIQLLTNLPSSLKMTIAGGMITIAVFKIQFKHEDSLNDIPDTVG